LRRRSELIYSELLGMRFSSEIDFIRKLAFHMESRIKLMAGLLDRKLQPPIEWFMWLDKCFERILRDTLEMVPEENRKRVEESFIAIKGAIETRWGDVFKQTSFKHRISYMFALLREYQKFLQIITSVLRKLSNKMPEWERQTFVEIIYSELGIEEKKKKKVMPVEKGAEGVVG